MSDGQKKERYSPLAAIAVVLAALVLFSVFFLGFLVAPLAILLLFYVGFAASDRSKKNSGGKAPQAQPTPAAASTPEPVAPSRATGPAAMRRPTETPQDAPPRLGGSGR
jgi:hypothetical protein